MDGDETLELSVMEGSFLHSEYGICQLLGNVYPIVIEKNPEGASPPGGQFMGGGSGRSTV